MYCMKGGVFMIVKCAGLGLTFTTTLLDLKQKLVRIKLTFLYDLVGRKLVLQIITQTLRKYFIDRLPL